MRIPTTTGPEAFLRCVDRVAQRKIFGERRSFEGAEWMRRAGEILLGARACEREFQKLVMRRTAAAESSRRASVPDGKSQTATTETRHSRAAHPPPPPFGTEAWDNLRGRC